LALSLLHVNCRAPGLRLAGDIIAYLFDMVPIARRNLFHDKMKLATACLGVAFSVVLVTCLGGLFVNSSRNATNLVDNAGADVWIVSRGTRAPDLGEPISTRRLYQALATPGVQWAEPLIVHFSQWRLSDGRQEIAQVVGLEPGTRLNLPWGMKTGRKSSIRWDGGVIIDERERRRFGSPGRPLQIDDRVEILSTRARIAGFSEGVGTFTTIPYVFMTARLAHQCTLIGDEWTKFVLVKANTGVSPEDLKKRLASRMPELDVLTASEFARSSRHYWLYGTGIGIGIIFAASLGLVVGSVIVSQTVYASTLDRLAEYGTLKALGASNRRLAVIVAEQAVLLGLIGYAVGAVVTLLLSRKMPEWHLPVQIPLWLFAGMLAVTLFTCVASSITSIAKVFRLPPAAVFRS
jgi:putative ABC transport system permease protein